MEEIGHARGRERPLMVSLFGVKIVRLVLAVMVLAVMVSQAMPSRLAEVELQNELEAKWLETRAHIGEP